MDRWSDESVERVLVGRRANRRIRLRVGVEVNQGGTGWAPARLLEISRAGYRLEAFPRELGRHSMWLRLGEQAVLPAKVVWASAAEIGCEFLHPVKRTELEEIIEAVQPSTAPANDQGSSRLFR